MDHPDEVSHSFEQRTFQQFYGFEHDDPLTAGRRRSRRLAQERGARILPALRRRRGLFDDAAQHRAVDRGIVVPTIFAEHVHDRRA